MAGAGHVNHSCMCVLTQVRRIDAELCAQTDVTIEPDLCERACMWGDRLRIPCGKGFVSLPAMEGIG